MRELPILMNGRPEAARVYFRGSISDLFAVEICIALDRNLAFHLKNFVDRLAAGSRVSRRDAGVIARSSSCDSNDTFCRRLIVNVPMALPLFSAVPLITSQHDSDKFILDGANFHA